MVRQLLARGADVNMPDTDMVTPLMFAVRFMLPNVVDVLLRNGAHVSHRVRSPQGHWAHGKTALEIACADRAIAEQRVQDFSNLLSGEAQLFRERVMVSCAAQSICRLRWARLARVVQCYLYPSVHASLVRRHSAAHVCRRRARL